MRILILGGDGYLGWPTAMRLADHGHEVTAVDNYLRRSLCLETDSEPLFPVPTLQVRAERFQAVCGRRIATVIGDCTDMGFMDQLLERVKPEAVIHYAEQPSGPYSMMGFTEARKTLDNNLQATFNLIWAMLHHAPHAHLVKLGTMGEYGTPNIDIEEGWIDVTHKGRQQRFLYPRQASSLYHTTKVLDTDLLWFYVRTHGLAVTDLMQGPVYGLRTAEVERDETLAPHFNYDDIFGTVVNRFLVQAVAGLPLTVYGKGGQTRGYLNLEDTLQCVELSVNNPVTPGEMRILNQFTEQFTVLELAERVRAAGRRLGLEVAVQSIPNPRKEAEKHYYNPVHSGLLELGLKPHPMTEEVLASMLERILVHRQRIDVRKVMPRVAWNSPTNAG